MNDRMRKHHIENMVAVIAAVILCMMIAATSGLLLRNLI